jgi:hypothetical protein
MPSVGVTTVITAFLYSPADNPAEPGNRFSELIGCSGRIDRSAAYGGMDRPNPMITPVAVVGTRRVQEATRRM